MQFRRLSSQQGFGCLEGPFELSFEPNRLNLVIGANETGKSTLMQALFFGLFGQPKSRAALLQRFGLPKTKEDFKKRYQPWKHQGSTQAALSLSLELEHQDCEYRLVRQLEAGTATVWNLTKGVEETEQYQFGRGKYAIAENFLGFGDSVFLNTLCVTQNRLQAFEDAEDAAAVIAEIQRAIEAGPSGVTIKEAIQQLDAAQKKYDITGKPRFKNQIQELEKEKEVLDQELKALEQLQEQAMRALAENESLSRKIQTLTAEAETLNWLQKTAEAQALFQQLDQEQALQEKLANWEAAVEQNRGFEAFPIQHRDRLIHQCQQLRQVRQSIQETQAALPMALLNHSRFESLQALFPQVLASDFPEQLHKLQFRVETLREHQVERERLLSELQASGFDETRFQKRQSLTEWLTPEEIRFILAFPAQSVELQEKIRTTRALWLNAQGQELLQAKEQTKNREVAMALILTGGTLMLTSIGFFIFMAVKAVAFVLVAIGVLLLSVGVLLQLVSGRKKEARAAAQSPSAELESLMLDSQLQEYQGTLSQMEERRQSLVRKAKPAFSGDFQTLVGEILWWQEQAQSVPVQSLVQLRTNDAKLRAVMNEEIASLNAGLWLQGLGTEIPVLPLEAPKEPQVEGHDPFMILLQTLGFLKESWNQWKEWTEKQAELSRFQGQLQELRDSVMEIVSQAGIVSDFSGDSDQHEQWREDLLAKFEAGCQNHAAFLEAQKQLAQAGGNRLSSEALQSLQGRLDALREQLQSLPPDLGTVDRPESEYREALRLVQQSLEESKGAFHRSEIQAEGFRETIFKKRPQLLEQQFELESQLRRLKDFQSALNIAREGLEQIGLESHRAWAPALSQRTNRYLKGFQSPYSQIRFGDNLRFSLEDSRAGHWMDLNEVLQSLSCGARDQIYLAIRLAISEYLGDNQSQGGSLPVVLDDPFVNWDDTRFNAGMDCLLQPYLAQESLSGHLPCPPQLILLTCHGQRHFSWLDALSEAQIHHINVIDLNRIRYPEGQPEFGLQS